MDGTTLFLEAAAKRVVIPQLPPRVLNDMYKAAYKICEDMSTYNITGDARRHAVKAKKELWVLIQLQQVSKTRKS